MNISSGRDLRCCRPSGLSRIRFLYDGLALFWSCRRRGNIRRTGEIMRQQAHNRPERIAGHGSLQTLNPSKRNQRCPLGDPSQANLEFRFLRGPREDGRATKARGRKSVGGTPTWPAVGSRLPPRSVTRHVSLLAAQTTQWRRSDG